MNNPFINSTAAQGGVVAVKCNDCGALLPVEYSAVPRRPCPTCGGTKRDMTAGVNIEVRLVGQSVEIHTSKVAASVQGERNAVLLDRPDFLVKAAIVSGSVETRDGLLIESVGLAWRKILDVLNRDRNAAYELTARQWEEIIAGAYDQLGFDEVILTPASADHGRDVIATKSGIGSIRIYDQVKAYRPGNRVSANDVRAMLGVLSGQNVSKGIITTTSVFAPRIMEDPAIAAHVPYRLELKDRDALFPWLDSLRK